MVKLKLNVKLIEIMFWTTESDSVKADLKLKQRIVTESILKTLYVVY